MGTYLRFRAVGYRTGSGTAETRESVAQGRRVWSEERARDRIVTVVRRSTLAHRHQNSEQLVLDEVSPAAVLDGGTVEDVDGVMSCLYGER